MKLSRVLSSALLLALAAIPACAEDEKRPASSDAAQGDDQEIVDIPNTKVKDQSIGNCWVYATSAWAESLRMGYAGEEMNVSESFISYVDWFYGIQASDFDPVEGGITTGGWFGEAAEYLRLYGVMDEATFIPEEANSEVSNRQETALAAINESIARGVLSDPAKRRDKNVVRDELDKAFQLSPQVIALLDQSFGHDLSRTVPKGATIPAGKGLRKASEIEVGTYAPAGKTPKVITLADAIGTPTSASDPKRRSGTFAWNETSYPTPSTSRAYFKQMQRAMHARRPVILVWYVDFNAMDRSTGAFAKPPATPGHSGGHMTVLEDYQASNVPGYGTLQAGVLVTDPKELDAALADSAKIDFLRVKNSWGSGFAPPAGTELKGYHDLYMAYLEGQIPTCTKKDASGKCLNPSSQRGITSLVLPPAAWDAVTVASAPDAPPDPTKPATSCAHATCSTGDKLTAGCGDPCVDQVCGADPYCCNTKWDGVCVREVKSVCSQTCGK